MRPAQTHRTLIFSTICGAFLAVGIMSSSPASADIITPPGECVGTGHWVKAGLDETSTAHLPDDVISIPQSDTVQWTGYIKGYEATPTGPARDISGQVELVLPFGTVKVDSWGNNSVRYSNQGEHDYNLPSVLTGVKLTLQGEHREGGAVRCSGSVNVQVDGSPWSNPLSFASVGLLAISGGMLFFAGRPVISRH